MCQCPHGLLPHFYIRQSFSLAGERSSVNALTGCYLISTPKQHDQYEPIFRVSMPSRAVTSFLQSQLRISSSIPQALCQCPHGLLPHFYIMKNLVSQHHNTGVNALTGCYLISTVPLQKPRFYAVSRACFCRYLSEYSDSSSFSCMLTIWTYLMRQIIPLTLI